MDIVFLAFHGLTPLDLVGPYEVLSRVPNARPILAAPNKGTIICGGHLPVVAEHSLEEISSADILVVPGGPGIRDLLDDEKALSWVRKVHSSTQWTTSVCTGSLLLAASGILKDTPATTHWNAMGMLADLGAIPKDDRIVRENKIITAAGVSSGIDMALALAALIAGEDIAQALQLRIEYDPQPPFNSGSVSKATQAIFELAKSDNLKN
jgi:putative intracellular protease/amidase